MTDKEVMRRAMHEKQVTQRELASLVGYVGQSGIGQMLKGNSGTRADVLEKVLSALGYEIIVRNKETTEEWLLDMKSEEK
jgi:transcriptional regulator with XRE-family HTH domain